MFVSIGPGEDGEPGLEDASNFTEFYVDARGRALSGVAAALERRGAGYVCDGHAWVYRSFLEAELATAGDGWQPSFERMLVYARSRGWVSAEGQVSVRAHIEGSPES